MSSLVTYGTGTRTSTSSEPAVSSSGHIHYSIRIIISITHSHDHPSRSPHHPAHRSCALYGYIRNAIGYQFGVLENPAIHGVQITTLGRIARTKSFDSTISFFDHLPLRPWPEHVYSLAALHCVMSSWWWWSPSWTPRLSLYHQEEYHSSLYVRYLARAHPPPGFCTSLCVLLLVWVRGVPLGPLLVSDPFSDPYSCSAPFRPSKIYTSMLTKWLVMTPQKALACLMFTCVALSLLPAAGYMCSGSRYGPG